MRILRSIYHSFVVQLLLLHFKRHPVLLVLWLILFLSITNVFGTSFGIPYLFLDPEYLGKVNFLSFLIMGLSLGLFIMTYHIVSYMLNSYRFPFLATLQFPFYTYLLNNSILPLGFVITYIVILIRFQLRLELADLSVILINMLALIGGIVIMLGLFLGYFSSFNINIDKLLKRKEKRKNKSPDEKEAAEETTWEQMVRTSRVWPVENFISRRFHIRPVRGVEHYEVRMLLAVFRQHHLTALLVQILTISLLIGLGYLIHYPTFIIPAGGSIILLLATLMMFTGALSYWSRGWRFLTFVGMLIALSLLVRYGWVDYKNPVYGLNYNQPYKSYNVDSLKNESSFKNIEKDREHTLRILNNWKARIGKKKGLVKKPKIIFIAASGGGMRASLWSMTVQQRLDSLLGGSVFDHTMLMTGASGGMIGSAYFRELKWQQKQGMDINPLAEKYTENVAKDLLNPISFAIVVNDLFYPFREVTIDSMSYSMDRAYFFEKYLNRNTNHVFEKPLKDYRQPELAAKIPMLICSPTIVNDERFLFISPHPVRYLTRPLSDTVGYYHGGVDGVDFLSYFKEFGSENLRFSSALRVNATYPYVLPQAHLPTVPAMKVMDAGIRANFGIEPAIRFIHAFSDWIDANTSGVVIISINSVNTISVEEERQEPRNLLAKIFNPIGNLYYNWIEIQEYNNNFAIDRTNELLDTDVHFVEFNYFPGKKERSASMSFHLTTREKQNIRAAIDQIPNLEAQERLRRILEEE